MDDCTRAKHACEGARAGGKLRRLSDLGACCGRVSLQTGQGARWGAAFERELLSQALRHHLRCVTCAAARIFTASARCAIITTSHHSMSRTCPTNPQNNRPGRQAGHARPCLWMVVHAMHMHVSTQRKNMHADWSTKRHRPPTTPPTSASQPPPPHHTITARLALTRAASKPFCGAGAWTGGAACAPGRPPCPARPTRRHQPAPP